MDKVTEKAIDSLVKQVAELADTVKSMLNAEEESYWHLPDSLRNSETGDASATLMYFYDEALRYLKQAEENLESASNCQERSLL